MKYLMIVLLSVQFGYAQNVEGFWKTIDEDGIAKSIVKVYKTEEAKIEGKVYKILKASERDKLCTACKGNMKNEPVEGLVIMKDLRSNGEKYEDGQITDPENGKTYDCKIWLDEDNKDILHVRGYVSFFYRTQDWKRVEEGEF